MRIALDEWSPAAAGLGDNADFTCSMTFVAPVDGYLQFDGIATLATVTVDGVVAASSSSMWLPVRIPLSAGRHEIIVHCRALGPELEVPRKPRARWRQKVASHNNLRWFRTTLNGRAPGFAPGPPVVGLWRPAWFVAGEVDFKVRTRLEGANGIVTVEGLPDGTIVRLEGARAVVRDAFAQLVVEQAKLWWPHTHGDAHLYEVTADGFERMKRVGFRTVASPGDILRDGMRPQINGIDVFVRGAVWTPVSENEVRSTLETARAHGLNAVRVCGTMAYETREFHDLCDELGMLVWQDLMFANFDYPFSDPEFRAIVEAEVDAVADRVAGHPSTFCVCGSSETEQQAAMYGIEPAAARDPFFADYVPSVLAKADVDALYVPSAPCGADRPLIASQGVSNWFGVGGYRRPLEEARCAGVRFASECLAISNIPDAAGDPLDPGWKQGVPRDVGADWDFDDVRNHYLEALYDVDSDELRATDPERWIALSKQVSADVMVEVFGDWRRADSGCGGAFVLWLRDLMPGAGWGLIDSDGRPKPVLRALKQVLAPVAVWMTDEGLSGYRVHVANDGPTELAAVVNIGLIRRGEQVDGGQCDIKVQPRSSWSGDAETIIGRWVDIGYAYRFGLPAHDLVQVELVGCDGALLGTGRRYPHGRAAVR